MSNKSELAKRTEADKVYFLDRYGETIIVPTREAYNFASKKYDHLPTHHDHVLSQLNMADRFIPGLTSFLEENNVSSKAIEEVMANLFEKQKYLGFTWHRRWLEEDQHEPGNYSVMGDGSRKSFYGSDHAGKIIKVVTEITDFL